MTYEILKAMLTVVLLIVVGICLGVLAVVRSLVILVQVAADAIRSDDDG